MIRISLIKVLLLLAIASSAYSVVITCIFQNRGWVVISSQYSCEVVGIQNPEIAEVTKIIGNHASGRTNNDVKIFYSNRKDFLFFPKGLERFFTNLQGLAIEISAITSISSADLALWPNLEVFSVADNKIKTLDGNLFENSRKLQRIYIKNSLIQSVGINLLSNLNELTYADFQKNPCVNILAQTPQQIENLKTLLITQCSPVETTTLIVSVTSTESGQCFARCSLNEETDALIEESKAMRRELDHQKALVEEHKISREEHLKRIEYLENLFKEMTSGQCMPCFP